ncbi:sulfotransferase family protein [Elongatibacter sediminis]|uniref:Sulfotransferase family protein n=1 Tax=Elongatibacter sediminis TaxID=3119006 RepID=A0AAW9RI47_9GAMM
MRYTLWNKIFGIGPGRTGTTSLTDALGILGYRMLHYARPDLAVREDRLRLWWLYLARDGGTDTPVAAIFRKLDRLFPGSRFICTERDPETWLESMRRHYANRGSDVSPMERALRIKMYGTADFEPARLTQAYENHLDAVREHFSNRPDRLFRLRICDGEGWNELCAFLGKDIPDHPFPHAHKDP